MLNQFCGRAECCSVEQVDDRFAVWAATSGWPELQTALVLEELTPVLTAPPASKVRDRNWAAVGPETLTATATDRSVPTETVLTLPYIGASSSAQTFD